MAPNGQPRKGIKAPAAGVAGEGVVPPQKPKSARSLSFGGAPPLALKACLAQHHQEVSRPDWSIPASEHAAA